MLVIFVRKVKDAEKYIRFIVLFIYIRFIYLLYLTFKFQHRYIIEQLS